MYWFDRFDRFRLTRKEEKLKAIAYTRVSSDDQIKGTSLGTQLAEIKTYCAHHDLRIAGHFEDAGESAKTADRPGLIQALDACRKLKADLLVVHRLDRLSRNASDGLAIRAKLATHGCRLVSVSEPVSEEPAGQFLSTIMFAAAQFDNDIRSARSRSGMSATLLKGGWVWMAPDGFKQARRPDGLPVLEISHQDAPKLTALLTTYASGSSSLEATIRGFHAIGFDRVKASTIFRQPIYGGIIRTKLSKVDIQAAFPGFITPELWYKLESRYAVDKRQPRRDKPSADFPLTLCACSVCGSRLKGSNARSATGRLYAYYRCPGGHVNLKAGDLDAAVCEALGGLAYLAGKLKTAVELAVAHLQSRAKDKAKAETKREKEAAALRVKLATLAERYIEGDIDKPTYRNLQTKYNTALAGIQAEGLQSDNSLEMLGQACEIVERFKSIRAVWDNMDAEHKKKLLQTIGKPVIYDVQNKKVELGSDQFCIDGSRVLEASDKVALPRRVELRLLG